ncbi:protein disulfide-isomerase domain [Phytophthora cinnamomi]|uniref:protein disulfide-isomerase domain n=1 Tax=Phytophthora cinnamomi TaxID=4785 RepID=UPI003559E29E|nr:protein disulfide-isomerase domain [Phytophthora cinnamomi]
MGKWSHGHILLPERVVEQAVSDLKGSVNVAVIEATANEQKTAEYGIEGFPTIKEFGSTPWARPMSMNTRENVLPLPSQRSVSRYWM